MRALQGPRAQAIRATAKNQRTEASAVARRVFSGSKTTGKLEKPGQRTLRRCHGLGRHQRRRDFC